MQTRRQILAQSIAAGAGFAFGTRGASAQTGTATGATWDAGKLAHVLPTASHDRLLLKASFKEPLESAPSVTIASRRIAGRPTGLAATTWSFDAVDLKPDTAYRIELKDASNRTLSEPWDLRTMPAPDTSPSRLRLLVFTCAGGHDALGPINGITRFLPVDTRRRLLQRGLSFAPHAVIANGDHVYWDLGASRAAKRLGLSPEAIAYAGEFNPKLPVHSRENLDFVAKAAGQQIAPLYGTLCRSTPVYFLQDDHDYFDNDEADDSAVTFPPSHWMTGLARATQNMYFPEFLPDPHRPLGLPASAALDRPQNVSESFGTLRYGKLAEVLLYDVRRSMTMAGPSAVFIDKTVEGWLMTRMAAREVAHVVNIPSNPPGWSAGKWGEWYPDILAENRTLSLKTAKPYWQSGWLAQHDRLLAAMSAMPGRVPLVLSGDLHATAEGRIFRTGAANLERSPVIAVLTGTLGTGDGGWPSAFRGIGALPSNVLDMKEELKPIEENGFAIVDMTPDDITIQYFKWKAGQDSVDAIDKLEPFRTTKLMRPA